jgi:glycosyltransferase involved in cell wall biosynthesis
MTMVDTLGPLRADPVAAARHSEFEARRALAVAMDGRAQPTGEPAEPPTLLTLFVLMPRTDVGGGARVLIEHANRLTDRGHQVVLLAHSPRPTWCEVRAEFRQVPFGADLADGIEPCDLIVAGYWDQVVAAHATGLAPVLHFEQGDAHLFEEISDAAREFVQANVDAACQTITVSSTVAAVVRQRYGVLPEVLPNAIDPATFHPGERRSGPPSLLAVGWDGNEFKGIDDVRRVWERLRVHRPDLELIWVTPHPPLRAVGRVVVAPAQHELAEIYRQASVYLCASHYESFPLPPIEAMASGTPVVTTRNVGVLEYARHGENSLVVDIGDVEGLAAAVDRILDSPQLADALRDAGTRTAASYCWDDIVGRMEGLLREAAASRRTTPSRRGWTVSLGGLRFRDPFALVRLEHRLQTSPHREVAIPVAVPAFAGHSIVRWRVVARRSQGIAGRTQIPLIADPASAGSAPSLSRPQQAFAGGRPGEALAGFTPHLVTDPAASRWAALCLLELGRDDEAVELLGLALDTWPDYTDLHYLEAVAAHLTGRQVDRRKVHQTVSLLGPATRFAEWFDDPLELLRQRLPLEDSL